MFEGDLTHCNVLLNNEISQDISSRQFSVIFNWKTAHIILKNLSHHSITVKSSLYSSDSVKLRSNNTQILLSSESIKIIVDILKFELYISWQEKLCNIIVYTENWNAHCDLVQSANSSTAHLSFYYSSAFILMITKRGIYYMNSKISSSEFAEVHKIINSHTRSYYAVKVFIWLTRMQVKVKLL